MNFPGALLVRTRYLMVSVCWMAAFPAVANTPFTIVALPDTQNYVNSSANAPLFTQQTQWIADEIQVSSNPRNIQFVTHLGDLVSTGSNLTQWQRADTSMDVLDGVVPYSALPGNHDYNSTGNKSTGTVNYVNNFGPQRYAGESWYGGADPSGNNSYQLFSAGGYDFIHLALEWRPASNIPVRDPSPIEWAQSILDANPDTPVILSTHEHIDDDPPGRSAAGDDLWNELIRFNDQIFLVLNGHYHSVGGTNDGEYHQVSLNDANRPVVEVLQDYQDYPNGGDGWLRLINFDIPNNEIEFETYSPVLDQFQTERVEDVGQYASEFEIGINFATRLDPVFIAPPPSPDITFQNGVDGYTGTRDKEIRSSGGDSTNGQDSSISVDGDDGSPNLQPNHGLIAFDNIIGAGANQLPANADISQATLVLEVFNAGSGFTVHEMLSSWDENSTWQSLGSGVQADDVEASSTALATFGANNSGSNVGAGSLEIDVTTTIQDYLDGTLTNEGWALLPFTNGTDGIDFYSSEESGISVRPVLEIYLNSLPGDFNLDGNVDAFDFLAWQRDPNVGELSDWEANYGGSLTHPAIASTVPEPSGIVLLLIATAGLSTRKASAR